MQAEERDLIVGLFDRLQPFESQPRDPEAERLIAQLVQRQPAAPYLLAQTALVQEQALKAAQERIAELERQSAAPRQETGSFLGSAPRIGPWGARAASPEPAQRTAPQVPAPMAQQAAGGFGGGGGGFLRTAMMTAAGVAGGALLFEGIRGLLSNSSGPFAAHAAQPLMPPDQLASDNSLSPPDQLSSADLAGDDGSGDDYDLAAGDSGFDDGGGGGFDEL